MRRSRVILLAALAILVPSLTASAQTDICTSLEARLAQLDRSSNDIWNNGDAETAIGRKRADLDQATSDARRAGCYGGFLFKALKPSQNCGRLTANVNRIRAGLNRLEAEQQKTAGDPYAADQQRSAVLRELAANSCGGDYADRGGRRPGLLSSLFGGRRLFRDRSGFGGVFGGGTYRTLCVRSCDGYYFPISFSTTASAFRHDEATCRAMCPGADVALYVYRNPGEDSDQMVSLAGVPYTALPNAFRYRTQYDRACTCPPIAGAASATIIGAPTGGPVAETPGGMLTIGAPPPAATPILTPLPRAPAEGSADPESADNRAGGFVPGAPPPASTAESAAPTVVATGPDGKRIRVVGPAFYYTQQ